MILSIVGAVICGREKTMRLERGMRRERWSFLSAKCAISLIKENLFSDTELSVARAIEEIRFATYTIRHNVYIHIYIHAYDHMYILLVIS